MRSLLCLGLLFTIAISALAGDTTPPRLSPKEIAEGWISLFDGETGFGWKVEGGQVTVRDGVLLVGGDKATQLFTTTEFGPGELRIECRWKGKEKPTLFVRGKDVPALSTVVSPDSPPPLVVPGFPGEWSQLKIISEKATQQGWLKSKDRGSTWSLGAPDPARGKHGFKIPAGTTVEIRRFQFKPLDLTVVFNGRDLAGWKEFPGQKSTFSVTPEGWLNVKNGKGDLQTVGKWADFTLQVECISNGDYLNSGIFFRCQPDKYQQGYEAQIHNKFNKEADKTYVIEDYDPKTHMLVGKRKEKYQAVDYGTGAIYRRIPARKQMSRDREWFTMTVIAVGRHVGVWVNGVQVTDWTDNRPAKDNAREGYRQEAGPISIQGHDPTTDLSFRNIRIAELPATK
jgi:hypothetical protein